MGARGPRPTPTPILKIRGSRWADRPNEPQPPQEAPNLPTRLSAAEKRVWKKTVPLLQSMGVLSVIDVETLARYCSETVRYWDGVKIIRKEGETYTTDKGVVHKHPLVEVLRGLGDSLRRIECEFGMTPASRTRIHVKATTKTPADDLAEFVKTKHA